MMNSRQYIFQFISILLLMTACHPKKTTKIDDDFWLQNLPVNVSYSFRINKKIPAEQIHLSVLDEYLAGRDKKFIDRIDFKIPYAIHIFQKDAKLKSFLVIGKSHNFDKLFNEKTSDYNGISIYQSVFQKQPYYAFQKQGILYVSNRSLTLENIIRNFVGVQKTDSLTLKINELLDPNSDLNLIQFSNNIRPDSFNRSLIKISPDEIDRVEGFDIVDHTKDLYTGIALYTTEDFTALFENINPLEHKNFDLIPVSVSQFSLFSTDDWITFFNNYNNFSHSAGRMSEMEKNVWESLQSVLLIKENHNFALILDLGDINDFLKDKPLEENFMGYSIRTNQGKLKIVEILDKIFPVSGFKYFLERDNKIILTQNISYLRKLIVDIDNHNTLAYDNSFKKIIEESPAQEHWINFLKTNEKYIYKSYNKDDKAISISLLIEPVGKQNISGIEQFLSMDLDDVPVIRPQLVYNYKHKTYRIVYQNQKNELIYADMSGKILWKRDLGNRILGKIHTVDIYRNGKTQYTFLTPDKWFIIDRYGRDVEGFPVKFSGISKGLSVFDYDKNRKYRFGVTQGKKFSLFDNKGKKVKGFKVKTNSDIQFPPQHFRISSKDFIEIQESDGQLNLLDRRGNTRIKVDEKFDNLEQDWKIYHKKFINILDNGKIISIDLKGKIKKADLNIGKTIRFQTGYNHFAAVSDNKLLIDTKIYPIDLGNHQEPFIYKTANGKILIFISDQENKKIFAYNTKGQLQKGFPVIGQMVLDVKKQGKTNYLLIYDASQNILIYKF